MSKSNGIGITGVLFLIFLVLKLAEVGSVAAWSWWWVTSPLWIPFGLWLALIVLVTIGGGIVNLAGRFGRNKRMNDVLKGRR